MNTEDRELLEMAAKAVGMPSLHDANGVYGAWVGDPHNGHWWNPLEDDGDALRLAVKLGIEIEFFALRVYAGPRKTAKYSATCSEEGDLLAAARRVIVRASAEIGRAMP